MKKLLFGFVILVLLALVGCSQKEDSSNIAKLKDNPIESIASIEDQISDDDYDSMMNFGKAFVNLYTGAVAKQETVSFEHYILNENLLKFTNKMLELEQKQDLIGGMGVNFGLENEFKEAEYQQLDEDLYYLSLTFSNQGSGMSCKLLVQSDNKSLKIVDLYFGNKDGVDTVATGHPAVRKVDNPKLWDDPKWVDEVFEKLEKYESELSS
ncbi:hypothetical protein [Paenibacillus segetis]|uniref:Uncharacterized protein n=1 Tax=Paenibacillus segetis TaxID=1325360 RepID=A0ABQ1YEJ9_9BACL|nr:hypothetical protein [Paenibacillus segetis]GGH23306.1 hypothetical protein GCM10008013_22310 [Paenibacillus segetis]